MTVVDSFSYDAYGVMLGGNPAQGSTPATNLLYAGEQWDTNAQHYYNRARWYNPLTGLFNRTDPYSGNLQDPQSLHRNLYCQNNPVNNIDPSGEQYTAVGTLTVVNVMTQIISASFPYVTAGLLALTATAALCLVYDLSQDYIAAGLTAVAAVIMSNTRAVVKAIDDVAKALRKTVRELQKFKFFPVIKSLTPKIFAFNVSALATHPWWFMLNYVGAGPAGDFIAARNRSIVEANWGYLRLTAKPGYQLDEFPYARTKEGGYGAMAHMVDPKQHLLQAGFFGAFCRWTMRGSPGQFIVVPIPL